MLLSQVEDHLTPRSAAANKCVSLRGRIQRLGVVVHVAGNQRRFAGVADPGSTGPPHRHIACFCKFEQTLVFASQGNVTPLRAKETCGPKPAGPAGKCGE